jgi:hypothetical protein
MVTSRAKSLAAKVAAISLALTALTGAGASAAMAVSMPSSCSEGYVCLYEHQNFASRLGYRLGGFSIKNVKASSNDKMTSWANRSKKKGCWFTDIDGGGAKRYLYSNANNPKVDLNDQLSSWAGSGC